MPPEIGERRCGFVTILGATNAGKSTLVNALVGTKVAIVSHKVQTTRAPIRGIAMEGQSQIVFTGYRWNLQSQAPARSRDDRCGMERHSKTPTPFCSSSTLRQAADEDVMRIVERLKSARMPRIAVLNKIDRVEDKPKLLALAKRLDQELAFDRIFMVSALEGKGVADLRTYLADLFPSDRGTMPKTT